MQQFRIISTDIQTFNDDGLREQEPEVEVSDSEDEG